MCLVLLSSLFQVPEDDVCLRLRPIGKIAGEQWVLKTCIWNVQVLQSTILWFTKKKDMVKGWDSILSSADVTAL